MQKIIIDARIRQSSTGRYIDRLIEHLYTIDSPYHYIILVAEEDPFISKKDNFEVVTCPYKPYSFNPLNQITFAWWLKKLNADLLHSTLSPLDPVFYLSNMVTTTHDLTLYKYNRTGQLPAVLNYTRNKGYQFFMWNTHKKAAYVITPTKFVKDAVASKFNYPKDRIIVTYESSEPPLVSKAIAPNPKPQKYILYVGNSFEHKNLERLAQAFQKVKQNVPELQLVLAGKRDYYSEQLEEWIANKQISDVLFPGRVSDEELKWLYQNAEAYVFASLSEGFGLPPLEAMAHDCPVVSSKATCLPEVYGDAAVYFDPENVEEMAEVILSVLKNKKLQKKLVDNGKKQLKKYSWKRMAQQTHDVYEKALSKNHI